MAGLLGLGDRQRVVGLLGDWRSQLPGTYVDRNGELQIVPTDPAFRALGDPLRDTRDNMELDYRGFDAPLPGWPEGGWSPGGAYQMPPQWWAGPNRET